MPERKSMRRIKACLRLHFESGLSQNAISRTLQVSRSTVQDYLRRIDCQDKRWPELKDLTDEQLEALLFSSKPAGTERPQPDWEQVHKELYSKSYVTLQILWQEYEPVAQITMKTTLSLNIGEIRLFSPLDMSKITLKTICATGSLPPNLPFVKL